MRRIGVIVFAIAIAVVSLPSVATMAGGAGSRADAQTTGSVPQAAPTAGRPLRIRAFGDAVTAGFGVFADGTPMSFAETIPCLPHNRLLNDRCSSNSVLGAGDTSVGPGFSADFGLGNGFSWAAQIATSRGTVDYANYAVSGSEPRHWMNLSPDAAHPDDGYLHDELLRLEADDPDLVLMTLGGSTMLGDAFGGAGLACVSLRDEATQAAGFRGCIDSILNAQLLKQSLMAIYFDVLAQTPNTHIVASTYSASFPALSLFEPWQRISMTDAVNGQITAAVDSAKAAGATWAQRLAVSFPEAPGTLAIPVSPGGFRPACWQLSIFSRSLLIGGNRSFDPECAARQTVLDSDLGIHPNRVGQMAYASGARAAIDANDWFPAASATP
jgi:hypothetical protein